MSLAHIISEDVILWDRTYSESRWYPDIRRKIDRFASQVDCGYYHRQRVAGNKVRNDIAIGKYGEIFTNQLLIAAGFPVIKVDLNVYDKDQKSFAADLPYDNSGCRGYPNVHVKTCTAKTVSFVGQKSWTFQWGNVSDVGGRDDLFDGGRRNDVVAFVYIEDIDAQYCTLVATAPFHVLAEHKMLKLPKRADHASIKRCVYYDDLVTRANELRRVLKFDNFCMPKRERVPAW